VPDSDVAASVRSRIDSSVRLVVLRGRLEATLAVAGGLGATRVVLSTPDLKGDLAIALQAPYDVISSGTLSAYVRERSLRGGRLLIVDVGSPAPQR
jgi:hypothetical protein